MFRKTTILVACLFCSTFLLAQSSYWTLERCIDYAFENSLTMKQAQIGIRNAELSATQNNLSRLPNLNGSSSFGLQFGRTIDPTTNEFDNQTIGFNSFSINLGWTVFNRGRQHNLAKQGDLNLQAAKLDAEATFNTLALNIAGAYLQVLLAEEQLENTRRQLSLSEAQLQQINKLIDAGSRPENDRLDILSQIAQNEQSVILAENAVETNYLTLKQLLELDPSTPFQVVRPDLDIPVEADVQTLVVEEIYSSALGTQPQIKAGDVRLRSAEHGVSIANAIGWPSLSLFGQLNTNWSSVGKQVTGTTTDFFPLVIREPGGGTTTLEVSQEVPILIDNPYFGQLDQNFGQSVGISLQVPIFNGLRSKMNTERAQLDVLNTKLNNDLAKQQLKTDVQRAVADVRAARKAYEAADKALQAATAAYNNAQRRFDLGAVNTFELTSSQNAKDRAEIERTRAKFQYLFNLKVVDFYLGKELRLE